MCPVKSVTHVPGCTDPSAAAGPEARWRRRECSAQSTDAAIKSVLAFVLRRTASLAGPLHKHFRSVPSLAPQLELPAVFPEQRLVLADDAITGLKEALSGAFVSDDELDEALGVTPAR